MRVVKERVGRVVRRVLLVDEEGERVGPVCRFLAHLGDRNFSPNTLCAYGYDLKYLFTFLEREGLDWQEFRPPHALHLLAFLRRVPSRRPAQRLGLAVVADAGQDSGMLLSPATVDRILAAVGSFYDWAIVAEEYEHDTSPRPSATPPSPAASANCSPILAKRPSHMKETHDRLGTPGRAPRWRRRPLHTREAAAGLIIAHGTWLGREDFQRLIHHGRGTAAIDWEAAISALGAGGLPSSGGEQRVLRLAASLACDTPVGLGDAITGIDGRNVGLLITAVRRASGRSRFAAHG